MHINPFQQIISALKNQQTAQTANNPSALTKASAGDHPPIISAAELITKLQPKVPSLIEGVIAAKGSIPKAKLPEALTKALYPSASTSPPTHKPTQTTTDATWLRIAIAQQASVLLVLKLPQQMPAALNTNQAVAIHIAPDGHIALHNQQSKPPPATNQSPDAGKHEPLPPPYTREAISRRNNNLENLPKRLVDIQLLPLPRIPTRANNAENNSEHTSKPMPKATTLVAQSRPAIAITSYPAAIAAAKELNVQLSSMAPRSPINEAITTKSPRYTNIHSNNPKMDNSGDSSTSSGSNKVPISQAVSLPRLHAHQTLTLLTAIKQLPPIIKQQLLPPQIEAKLSPLISAPNHTEQSAESIKNSTGLYGPATLLQQLQQIHQPLVKLAGGNDAPSALAILLRGMPSSTSSQEQVLEKRQSIARWLLAETNAQLARSSSQQTSNLLNNLEAPAQAQINQELSIRWGDEVALLQVRIKEDLPEENTKPAETQKTQASQWQIQLSLELPGGSNLDTELTFSQDQVDLQLWTEDIHLLKQLMSEEDSLATMLEQDGISLGSFAGELGKARTTITPLKQTLVDIKT